MTEERGDRYAGFRTGPVSPTEVYGELRRLAEALTVTPRPGRLAL